MCMNKTENIRQLWEYLKLKADETLIIPIYNKEIQKDNYLIAKMLNGAIHVETADEMPELSLLNSFHLVKHIGENGNHELPSVEQMERDKDMDY